MLPPLCSDDRRRLLLLARATLTEVILYNRIPESPTPSGRLVEPAGAFVTLRNRGRLRGCVGLSGPSLPVSETVIQAAASVARCDPRFPAVAAEELAELEIEISVLSEPRPIAASAIEVGRHGLLVIRGRKRGLLLPQVATEHSWSAQRFLEETCRKAGLQTDAAWDPETELLAFTAEVFSERELPPVAMGAASSRGPSEQPEPEG
jgi:AmmeMemoRadiSam system protein A